MLDTSLFDIVNKQITMLTTNERRDSKLRVQAIRLLTLIISLNQEQSDLIYTNLDIAKFLRLNVYELDKYSIDISIRFL